MLHKNVQTRRSHCLPPVKIFSTTSSTSVPTRVSAAPGCTVEKTGRLKGPLEARWHRASLGGERGGLPVILVNDVNSLEYHSAPKNATKDKRCHYTCGGISLVVIIRDTRPRSCSIGALCNFFWELEACFSCYYLPGFGNEAPCVWTVCSLSLLLQVTGSVLMNNNGRSH